MEAKVRTRNGRGSIAEIAPVIYAAFFFLLFPILNCATIGLRYALVMMAANDAANEAAIATTFASGNGPAEPSAKTAAETTAGRAIKSFRGLKLNSIVTRIVVTNLKTRNTTRTNNKLTEPADTSTNLYQLEPQITASIDPLVVIPGKSFRITGVTSPFTVQLTARKVAENPQGLNL